MFSTRVLYEWLNKLYTTVIGRNTMPQDFLRPKSVLVGSRNVVTFNYILGVFYNTVYVKC